MPEMNDTLMHSAIRRGGIGFGTADWEDVCQEARIQRWKLRDRPVPIQYGAIRFVTVNHLRRKLGRNNQKFNFATAIPIQTDEYTLQLPAPNDTEAVLDAVVLEAAFKVLTIREEYLVSRWASGYLMRELATTMGLSESRVSQLISRAILKMREEVAA